MDSNSISDNEPLHFEEKKSTMSETYKYYYKLVKESGKKLENLSGFSPSDESPLFERKLRLALINSLHLENEVCKILLSQNDFLISKVLGFKWFFKNLSSEFSTKNLFPFLSVSVRCKLITRLSKHLASTEEAEKYFEYVRNTFDVERANYLLPRCSPEFIWAHFEKTKLTFEHNNEIRILFSICKRYPELGIRILSSIFEIKKENKYGLSEYKKILLHMSGNHPGLIVPFIKKYYSCLPSGTFGIRLTKKLGSKLRQDLFPDLMKSFLFKEKLLFSMLSNEEQVKYLAGLVNTDSQNLSFQNWEASSYRFCPLLKLISEEKRLEMVESVFNEVYNSNFHNHSKCWTSELLELLPIATRKPFLQKLEDLLKNLEKTELKENVNSFFSLEYPEQLIYLHDSSTAFEKLKEIIRKSPTVGRRESILTFMVRNCSINNDSIALQQVVEFVVARHRNDDYSVISGFTNAISDYFPTSKLNSAIFEKLEELAYIFSLKRSSNDFYSYWKKRHIFYRLENNLEVDVGDFFQSIVLKANYSQSFVRDFKSKPPKTFVLAVSHEIIQWIRDKSSEELTDSLKNKIETLLMSLVNTCKDFNRKNKTNRIYIRDIPGLEEIIRKKAQEKFADVGGGEWPMDVWEIFLTFQTYGGIFDPHYRIIYLCYIVKRYPDLLVKYLDGVLKILLTCHFNMEKTFLNLLMVGLSFSGVAETFKKMIRNEFETHKRLTALALYSHVCTVEEFSSLVEYYVPKQEKVERKEGEFDSIQMSIPGLIRNIKPRWKNLNLIMKFYMGDFLKNALPSLSACCYHTRYDFVIPFLKEQLNAAPPKISHKKNIIRLLVELTNREDRSNFYIKCWQEYNHYSIRSILMLFVSKSFLEQPSPESFRALQKCILEGDELTIGSKPHLSKIPNEYFTDYVATLWQFSEGREKDFRDNFRREIFWGFNERNINLLPVEFCESVIKNDLFNSFSDNGIETFCVLYLAGKPETVERRVRFVLDTIRTRKPNPRSLFEFITILISRSQNRPAIFAEIFRILLENWPEYPVGVLFEERILLNYYYLYYKVLGRTTDPDKVPVEMGKELKNFFSNVENFKELVFIYSKVLKNFLKICRISHPVHVIRELVDGIPNRSLAILAVLSMPDETVVWHNIQGKTFNKKIIEGKKVLSEIFNAIKGCNDGVVDIYIGARYGFEKP